MNTTILFKLQQVKSIAIIFIIATQGIGFMFSVIATYDVNLSYRASYYVVRDAVIWMEKCKFITIHTIFSVVI